MTTRQTSVGSGNSAVRVPLTTHRTAATNIQIHSTTSKKLGSMGEHDHQQTTRTTTTRPHHTTTTAITRPNHASAATSLIPQHNGAVEPIPPIASFPTLDRLLAERGQSMRERRLLELTGQQPPQQQLPHQHQQVTQPNLYQPQPPYQPQPYSLQPQLQQHVNYSQLQPQYQQLQPTAFAQPLSQQPYQPAPLNPVASLPTPILDPEPLSPSILDDILLLPEVDQYIQELKEKWIQEYEREHRFPKPKSRTRTTTDAQTSTLEEGIKEEENDLDHQPSSSPPSTARVRFQESHETKEDERWQQLLQRTTELETQLSELRATLNLKEDELKTQLATIETLRGEKEVSTKLSREVIKERNLLQDEFQTLKAHESELRHQCTDLESKQKEFQTTCDTFLREQLQSDSTIKNLQAEKSAWEKEHESLNQQLKEQVLSIADLKAIQLTLQEELVTKDKSIIDLQQSLKDNKSSISKLEKEWDSKLREIETMCDLQIKESAARVDKYQMENKRLQSELKEMNLRFKEQEAQVDARLTKEEKEKQDQMKFIETLSHDLDALNTSLEKKETENRTLQGDLKMLLQTFESQKTKFHDKMQRAKEEVQHLMNEIEDRDIVLRTIKEEERTARMKCNELTSQLSELKEQIAQLTSTIKSLKDENHRLATRAASSDTINPRVESLERDLRIAQEIQARLEQEKERLAVKLDEAEEQLKHGHSSSHQHHQPSSSSQLDTDRSNADDTPRTPIVTGPSVSDLQRQLQTCQDTLAIKDKILDSLNEQLLNETANVKSLTLELKSLKKMNTELEQRVTELDEQRREATRELQALQQHDNAEVRKLDHENEGLKQEVELWMEKYDKIQQQLQKKKSSVEYIEKELEEMRTMFERKEKESKEKHDRELTELRRECERYEHECQQLQTQLNQVTKDYQDASNEAHQNESDLRRLLVEIEKERNQRKQMKQQLQSLIPDL